MMLSLTVLYLSTVKHNPQSGNLRTLVKRCLELATNLRDESQCERLIGQVLATGYMCPRTTQHNALLSYPLIIFHSNMYFG